MEGPDVQDIPILDSDRIWGDTGVRIVYYLRVFINTLRTGSCIYMFLAMFYVPNLLRDLNSTNSSKSKTFDK